MKRKRILLISALILLSAVSVFVLLESFASGREFTRIRERYEMLQTAMAAGDTNSVRLLYAPSHRSQFDNTYHRLQMFARPLSYRSGISIKGKQATICPQRTIPLFLFNTSGHTVEMIEVEGDWFFTGKVGVF